MELMQSWHLLRPWWLLALPLGGLLWWRWSAGRQRRSNWEAVLDPALAPFLLATGGRGLRARRSLGLLLLLLTSVALAGPVWRQQPRPLFRSDRALLVLLDLSSSMDAGDLSPSRLARAKMKVADLCRLRREGQLGLVVFAAEAFVVAPLTDDSATVAAQLPALETAMMPAQGSRPDRAVELALNLFRQDGLTRGELLLITDSAPAAGTLPALPAGFALHVLGVGSAGGAPVPLPQGGFLTDGAGAIVVPKLDAAALEQLATANHGIFTSLRLDDGDIAHLLPGAVAGAAAEEAGAPLTTPQWIEDGAWLLLPALPLAAWLLRGQLLVWLLLPLWLVAVPGPAAALDLSSWWTRPDRQAQQLFAQGDYPAAAKRFEEPRWQAAAQYRAGEFAAAAATLAPLTGAEDHYNRGNALAKAGQIPAAIAAYQEALRLDPDHADARYNRDLLQQQQQEQQDKQEKQGDKQDKQDQQNKQGDKPGDTQGDKQGDKQGEKPDQQDQPGKPGREQQGEQGQLSAAGEPQPGRPPGEQSADAKPETPALSPEELQQQELQQANEQWLRQIPDDPGGLLRRKFQYLYRQKQSTPEREAW